MTAGTIARLLCGLAAVTPSRAQDWPSWSGPRGTFAAAEGHALVEDLHQARFLWKSEPVPPTRTESGDGRIRPAGGGASPVVKDGRVYVSFFRPGGSLADPGLVERFNLKPGDDLTPARIGADDVVLCLDAATGRTIWSHVFPDEGLNWHGQKFGPWNHTPLVAAGRVFVVGSTGRVRALDAASGDVAWRADIGDTHRELEALKRRSLEEGAFQLGEFPYRERAGAPAWIGGRVVIPDYSGREACGLVALDPATGETRWRIPGITAPNTQPAAWRQGGRDLVVAATVLGDVSLIDPANGRLVWTYSEAGHNPRTLTVAENTLLLNLGPVPSSSSARLQVPKTPSRLGALDLRTGGPGQRWILSASRGPAGVNPVAVRNGHAYAHLPADKRVIAVELATGRVVGEAPTAGGDGFVAVIEDRLLVEHHSLRDTPELLMFRADPAAFGPLGKPWTPPHAGARNTAGPMAVAYAGGRLYFRAADAIRAYDLRKPETP